MRRILRGAKCAKSKKHWNLCAQFLRQVETLKRFSGQVESLSLSVRLRIRAAFSMTSAQKRHYLLPIETQKNFCLVGDIFQGGAVVSYPLRKETRDDSSNVLPW